MNILVIQPTALTVFSWSSPWGQCTHRYLGFTVGMGQNPALPGSLGRLEPRGSLGDTSNTRLLCVTYLRFLDGWVRSLTFLFPSKF